MILPLLSHIPIAMDASNEKGQTIENLLEVADTLYQYYTTKSTSKELQNNSVLKEDDEWQRKLAAEMEDEYAANWGRYESDFLEDTKESEDYDAWAERILRERRKTHEKPKVPLPPKPEKTEWTPEDQKKFLEEEERRRGQLKTLERAQKRTAFCSKLLRMTQKTTGAILEVDLPFALADDVSAICDLIVMDLEELKEDPEVQRKAHRDLQRLWHPDKFAQKFGSQLAEDIRPHVLKKITEISQNLNVYVCKVK